MNKILITAILFLNIILSASASADEVIHLSIDADIYKCSNNSKCGGVFSGIDTNMDITLTCIKKVCQGAWTSKIEGDGRIFTANVIVKKLNDEYSGENYYKIIASIGNFASSLEKNNLELISKTGILTDKMRFRGPKFEIENSTYYPSIAIGPQFSSSRPIGSDQ